jgi:hypothetical protein
MAGLLPTNKHAGAYNITAVLEKRYMCYQLLSLYTSDCRCRNMNINMEHWWNDTDSGKLKYIKKNCSVHPNSHKDWPLP